MIEVIRSETFSRWLGRLRDRQAAARIRTRIDRVALGNIGDTRSVGGGISELRINYGPGYRLYYTRRGEDMIILLCGGDKDSQRRDIERAKEIAIEWRRASGEH